MVGPSSLLIVVPSQTINRQTTVNSSYRCAKNKASSSYEKIKTSFFVLELNWHFAFLYQILYNAIFCKQMLYANYRSCSAKKYY